MFFRPKFCANCGEKIERADWGPLVSRRFCPVCEIEFKGQEMLPKAAVVMSLLFASVCGVAYLRGTPRAPEGPIVRPARAATQQTPAATPLPSSSVAGPGTDVAARSAARAFVPQAPAATAVPRVETVSDAYICGAETKKGTPCSRRVRGNVRCYQHQGMPAMLPPDKLKIG